LIEVLKFVELEKWANEESLNKNINSESVSGGEAKRIELARLLLQKKEIIILDEFSSGLDKETLEKIEDKIFSLSNKTILYVTHVYNSNLINKADEVIQF
jgi:ATP-binding cassette subfamily B protein